MLMGMAQEGARIRRAVTPKGSETLARAEPSQVDLCKSPVVVSPGFTCLRQRV